MYSLGTRSKNWRRALWHFLRLQCSVAEISLLHVEMYPERRRLQLSFRLQALAASRQWLLLEVVAGSIPARGGWTDALKLGKMLLRMGLALVSPPGISVPAPLQSPQPSSPSPCSILRSSSSTEGVNTHQGDLGK